MNDPEIITDLMAYFTQPHSAARRAEDGMAKYEYVGDGMTAEQADAFGDWLNRWASLFDHPERTSRDYRKGYERAVTDIMGHFTNVTGWGYKRVRAPRKATTK